MTLKRFGWFATALSLLSLRWVHATNFVVTLRENIPREDVNALAETVPDMEEIVIGKFRAWIMQDPVRASELEGDGRVDRVEPDGEVHISQVSPQQRVCVDVDRENVPWHLDRISHRLNKKRNPREYVHRVENGNDTSVVYVLDTGVQADHPDLEKRVVQQVSFSGGDGSDHHGHGTHVAGLIASQTYGSSKKAHLINVQVLNDAGQGSWTTVLRGVQWVVQHYKENKSKYKRGILSASIGGPVMRAINDAFDAAVDEGLVVVVAAGNEGKDACLSSPASASHVITVGATNWSDEISRFSNRGPCVSIFAPGEQIHSLLPDGKNGVMSGTSMACPVVSGIVALNVLANKTPLEVKAWLESTGTRFNGSATQKLVFNGACTVCEEVFT